MVVLGWVGAGWYWLICAIWRPEVTVSSVCILILINSINNKAVTDHRLRSLCCHLRGYFKHTLFSCRYIRRDNMCKHDVINTQHAHCGLVGLQEVVPIVCCLQWVFLCIKSKAACKPHCLSLATTSSSLNLRANMTSAINRKNAMYHYTARGGPSQGHMEHAQKIW